MRVFFLAAAAIATALAWAPTAPRADMQRGRSLYEARCGGCHADSVHGRARREARDFAAVRQWVRRWSDNLGLKWSDDEVTDVAAYLNGRFYRYPCPPNECQATGRRDQGLPLARLDGATR